MKMSNIYLHSYLEPRIIRLGYEKISDFVNGVVTQVIGREEVLNMDVANIEQACKLLNTKTQRLEYLNNIKATLTTIKEDAELHGLMSTILLDTLELLIVSKKEED